MCSCNGHGGRGKWLGSFPCLLLATTLWGCTEFRYDNTATVFDRPPRTSRDSVANIWLKTCYLYPVRDYLTLSWAGRVLAGDKAWNTDPDGHVADGPFIVDRKIATLALEEVRSGPCLAPPPRAPWRIVKPKDQGGTEGFVGQDADRRTFFVKFEAPDYPELGTGAEMIGSRIYWLLGYHVPPTYLITVQGTGCPRYDGHRATASELVPGKVLGLFKFDRYRMRREVRALRLAAQWLNDTDRVDNNTLTAFQDGKAMGYLLDFNSCLGSWNGRPKDPWRGSRYAWDVEQQIVGLLTFGLLLPPEQNTPITSPALGRLADDPKGGGRAWRPQNPNTAFDRMTAEDAHWMAERILAITPEQIRAIVSTAEFSKESDKEGVLNLLQIRRKGLLDTWLRKQATEDVKTTD